MENFNIVWVEKIKWDEDKLQINEQELQRFLNEIDEDSFSYSGVKDETKKLKERITRINKDIEDIMDISTFDWWDINIKDWSQKELLTVSHIAKRINKAFSNFLKNNDATYLDLSNDLDNIEYNSKNWKMVQEIKKLLADFKKKKSWWVFWDYLSIYSTVEKIENRNKQLIAALK